MKTIVLVLFLCLTFLLKAQEPEKVAVALVAPKMAEQTITVGGPNAQISGFTNQAIQFAIDAVAKTGGIVKLNQGVYEIKAPVRMKSNVKLIGGGKETILKRGVGV